MTKNCPRQGGEDSSEGIMLSSERGNMNDGKESQGRCKWQEQHVQKPCGRRDSAFVGAEGSPVGLGTENGGFCS